jgi:hypothetical protein
MSHDGSTAADTTAPPGRHPFGLSTPARSGGRIGWAHPRADRIRQSRRRIALGFVGFDSRTATAHIACYADVHLFLVGILERPGSLCLAARSALNRWRRMPMHFTDHDEEGETRGPSSSPAGGSALVDLHQLVVATRGTGPCTPLGPSDHHRGVCAHGGCRGRGRTHRVAHQLLVNDVQPRRTRGVPLPPNKWSRVGVGHPIHASCLEDARARGVL